MRTQARHESFEASFWRAFPLEDLAERCAILHEQRDELITAVGAAEVRGARTALAAAFCRGRGVEVGAGDRPFPIPLGAHALYGDVRDAAGLKEYFSGEVPTVNAMLDAETLDGIADNSMDFVISAHVIEHLFNPVGSIAAMMRVLKPGKYAILVVPELTLTFDRDRPGTTVEEVLRDFADNGAGTKLDAYREHVRLVHPIATGETIDESEVDGHAHKLMDASADIHVHAWRRSEFDALLATLAPRISFRVHTALSIANENLFVLRKQNRSDRK